MWLLCDLFYRVGRAKTQRKENAVELNKANGEWVYNSNMKESPSGRLQFQMMAAIAEFERANIAENVKKRWI